MDGGCIETKEKCEGNTKPHKHRMNVMAPPFRDKNDVAFRRNKIWAGCILYRKRLRLPLHRRVGCFLFILLLCLLKSLVDGVARCCVVIAVVVMCYQ